MLSKYDLHYLVNHFFCDVSGVLVCVPFDVSFLCVFLLFVCNPAKVCLREKEDLTISCVVCFFVVVLCFFLLGVCFLTVCVQSRECLFLGEGSIDYLFVVLCCSFLFFVKCLFV